VAFATVFAPFAEITPDEFRRVTEVSYLGFVNGTMVALDRMRRRDSGTIVQAGSALGARSIPLKSATLVASKIAPAAGQPGAARRPANADPPPTPPRATPRAVRPPARPPRTTSPGMREAPGSTCCRAPRAACR